MVSASIEQPAVYTGLANILKELGVAKNGTLPTNMGGGRYISAVDVATEVKKHFVEQDLIFVPNERIFKHETIVNKDRLNVLISITGEYTIISTKDGSSVTISGTGDGLATGSAVASNIASTNAFKNSLLRAFLITEQSVEDEAKNGPSEAANPTAAVQRKVDNARQTATPAASGSELDTLKAQVRTWINGDEGRRTLINTQMEALKSEGKAGVDLQKALVEYTKTAQ